MFRVTMDGSGDVNKKRRQKQGPKSGARRNGGRRRDRGQQRQPRKPLTSDDLDAEMDAYRTKQSGKSPKDVTQDALDAEMDAYRASSTKKESEDVAGGEDEKKAEE